MESCAAGTAFAGTGALFVVTAVMAAGPMVNKRIPAVAAALLAAALFFAAWWFSRAHDGWTSSPWLWGLTALPIALMVRWGVRAAVEASHPHSMGRCAPTRGTQRRRESVESTAGEGTSASRALLASDPGTPGTELADLAYEYPELRLAIAANPSTPANVLGWLASNGPEGTANAIAGRRTDRTPGGRPSGPGETGSAGL